MTTDRADAAEGRGRCEHCNHPLTVWDTCDACDLYNAAVAAQKAAAQHVAISFDDGATEAWLNEHGVFAYVDGVAMQVGTPEQAAPFVALTGQALKVERFWRDREPTADDDVEGGKEPSMSWWSCAKRSASAWGAAAAVPTHAACATGREK